MPYLPSFLKENLYPSFEQCKKAEQKAEIDDPKTRDTRELMAILMRLVEANPRLRGHILTRRTALSSFTWDIVPYETTDEQRATDAQTRLRKAVARIISNHTDSPLFGAMVLEMTWEKLQQGSVPTKITRLLPVQIEQAQTGMEIAKVNLEPEKVRTPLDTPQKYIIDTYSDGNVGGTLRGLMRQQVLLDMQYKGYAEFNKRLKGILRGTWKEATDEINKQTTLDAIKNVGANDYAATDDSIVIELIEAVSKGGHAAYNELIDRLNANTAIAVLGQANTAEITGTGSRAALQVLKMISADIMYEDMQRAENVINEQLLTYDFQLNYDINALEAPYKFSFNWHEENDVLSEAQVIREVLAAGVPLPKNEVYNRIGYTMPEAGTEVIGATTPNIAI